MEQTITAIYENGKLLPLIGKLPEKKTKARVTILEEPENEHIGFTPGDLKKLCGRIKSYPKEAVKYQRKIRNEW